MKISKSSNITYKVTQCNDFTEPYAHGEDVTNIVRHKTYDEYVTHDEKTFHDILNEYLDAPKKKLTTTSVRKDFDDVKRKLSDDKVEMIKKYYNGRYDLSKKIFAKLKNIDLGKIEVEYPVVMKFKIPFYMNYFTCVDDDPYDSAVSMNDAWIKIIISKDEMDDE